MPIEPGTRLGPYEILSLLGKGGMGEVWRARDTRLDRTVAIKVLPEHVAGDPQLKERFEREAKALSSLNHPHICTIYDVGSQADVDFLIDRLEGALLRGTEDAGYPFFSPDGDNIAFISGAGDLKRTPTQGGPVVTIVRSPGIFRGAHWRDDGTILFANSEGFFTVPAAGGETAVVQASGDDPQNALRWWPETLPGGRAILFQGGATEQGRIFLLDPDTHEERFLLRGSGPRYSPTGHILYGVDGTLWAVPFDVDRLELTGDPVPVVDGVGTKSSGVPSFELAADGSLAYVTGGGSLRTVVWVDRDGREAPLPGLPPDAYIDVRVSPDGEQVGVVAQGEVWTYDVGRATLSRLTRAGGGGPLWSEDGGRVVFNSARAGFNELFWRRADGSGAAVRLLRRGPGLVDLRASDWSPDGRVLFTEVTTQITCHLGQASGQDDSEGELLLQDGSCNDYPAVSPDGRWIAYESSRSGRSEIYVERYPDLGDREQISTSGGRLPLWSADGRELFFSDASNRQMMTVAVEPGPTLVASRPEVLFEKEFLAVSTGYRPYDIAPDGRFAMIASGASARNVVLVQNFGDELRRLVPAN